MSFKPKFMHQFLEDDLISGYQGLRLDFYFAPLTMDCYFNYSFTKRSRDSINLELYFEPYFKNGLIRNRAEFVKRLEQQNKFQIPGTYKCQVVRSDARYDTYVVADLTEKHFNWFLRNFQIFLLFFIESGCLIDTCDQDWKLVMMIEKVDSSYLERR